MRLLRSNGVEPAREPVCCRRGKQPLIWEVSLGARFCQNTKERVWARHTASIHGLEKLPDKGAINHHPSCFVWGRGATLIEVKKGGKEGTGVKILRSRSFPSISRAERWVRIVRTVPHSSEGEKIEFKEEGFRLVREGKGRQKTTMKLGEELNNTCIGCVMGGLGVLLVAIFSGGKNKFETYNMRKGLIRIYHNHSKGNQKERGDLPFNRGFELGRGRSPGRERNGG